MKKIIALALGVLTVAASAFAEQEGGKAVSVARAHIEAWSNHRYDIAKTFLAPDVHVTATTTLPVMSATNLVGIDNYMEGLAKFAGGVKAGSARILHASGDDRNALIVVQVKAVFAPGAPEVTLTGARLYRLDDNNKIETEQVIFYVASN